MADPPPVVCTLGPGQVADRVEAWRRLADGARRRDAIPGGVRLTLDHGVLQEAAQLVAAEHQCCAFFSFALTVDHRGLGLEVTAPPEGRAMVSALLGPS